MPNFTAGKICLQPGTKRGFGLYSWICPSWQLWGGWIFFITHPFKLYRALNFCIIKGVATWVTAALTTVELGRRGFSKQLHPRPTFLPIFDYPVVMRSDAAKMAMTGSAHFDLQKCSSETYGWCHGHYAHVLMQSMISPSVQCHTVMY